MQQYALGQAELFSTTRDASEKHAAAVRNAAADSVACLAEPYVSS